jgi:hypothetical protein
MIHFFFDEIQLVSGWEKFVRRLLDTENVGIYVSGSSAKLLSREMSMIGLIVPPVIAVMEPLRSVPKATSDGSSNYGFSPPFGVVFSAL